jgi:uncharacterized protein
VLHEREGPGRRRRARCREVLHGFTRGERLRHRERFVDAVLGGELPKSHGAGEDPLLRLLHGGYLEATSRPHAGRQRAFFDACVTTILTRDVRDIAAIEEPGALRRLLHLCAIRSASLLNHTELSRTLALPVSTLKRYLALLETFLQGIVLHLGASQVSFGLGLTACPLEVLRS